MYLRPSLPPDFPVKNKLQVAFVTKLGGICHVAVAAGFRGVNAQGVGPQVCSRVVVWGGGYI